MFQVHTEMLENDDLKICLYGALDVGGIDVFEKAVAEIDFSAVSNLRIDFENVKFIDSTGISTLLHLINIVEERNITYEFNNVQNDIQEIFSIVGLEDLLMNRAR